jgi:aminomethyltransferase
MTHSVPLRQTALYDFHVKLGARMAPFAGYSMPIQYNGILLEHHATRRESALFDTGHMGEFRIHGSSALADIERLVSCEVASLQTGQCRYGMLCAENGTVMDDLLVYRLGMDDFMLVVNAGTKDDDAAWIQPRCSTGTIFENLCADTSKLDLQGPKTPALMARLVQGPIASLKFYTFTHATYRGRRILISRTGYTGEIGFEVFCDHDLARAFWSDCMNAGVQPVGLGARDTLRLEMGMPLYGHELDRNHVASEAGFVKALATTKPFVGSVAIRDEDRRRYTLTGLVLDGRRAARNGDTVCSDDGSTVGTVTSGSFAPSIEKAVALAYIEKARVASDASFQIRTARLELVARVAPMPFYTGGTARKPIKDFLGGM